MKKKVILFVVMALLLALPFAFGCATPAEEVPPPPPEEDLSTIAPTVDPVELGFPAILQAPIGFTGSNWKPGEVVFVEMVIPADVDMPGLEPGNDAVGVAFGTADESGNVEAAFTTLAKLNFLFRAGWDEECQLDPTTLNPIPPRTYEVRAKGLVSNKVAVCTIELVAPAG